MQQQNKAGIHKGFDLFMYIVTWNGMAQGDNIRFIFLYIHVHIYIIMHIAYI